MVEVSSFLNLCATHVILTVRDGYRFISLIKNTNLPKVLLHKSLSSLSLLVIILITWLRWTLTPPVTVEMNAASINHKNKTKCSRGLLTRQVSQCQWCYHLITRHYFGRQTAFLISQSWKSDVCRRSSWNFLLWASRFSLNLSGWEIILSELNL